MKWPLPKPHPRTERGERRFDQTFLTERYHGKTVNRDYAAHFFRWGFAGNFVKPETHILDVGCGPEQQLVKVLLKNLNHVPELYVGIDLNGIRKKTQIKWTRIHDEFNILERYQELIDAYGYFDTITCFEVIEHMSKKDGAKLLEALNKLVTNEGRVLISTPVYNGIHMAANHIHEYGFDEFKESVEKAGFEVVDVFGTFANFKKIRKVATKEELALVAELHKFYTYEVLSNFLAPKYPQVASNCCWVLKLKGEPNEAD